MVFAVVYVYKTLFWTVYISTGILPAFQLDFIENLTWSLSFNIYFSVISWGIEIIFFYQSPIYKFIYAAKANDINTLTETDHRWETMSLRKKHRLFLFKRIPRDPFILYHLHISCQIKTGIMASIIMKRNHPHLDD